MVARRLGLDCGFRSRMAGWLLVAGLVGCAAAPSPPFRWVKPGVNDTAAAREVADCREHANAVLAKQQGINQDISATLGRNWQLGSTYGIESQNMNRQAAGAADQALENCMLAKGFTKQPR